MRIFSSDRDDLAFEELIEETLRVVTNDVAQRQAAKLKHYVNPVQSEAEVAAIRRCVRRSCPLGCDT